MVTPSGIKVFILLLAIGLLIRFPYFFQAVINWDESTLVLMGQGILDGRLPYVELWENKPPVAFLAYAGFIGIFGKSIVAVRLGGLLCLAAGAYLIHRIGRRVWDGSVGFIAAALTLVFVSLTEAGQATMTEVVALPPLLLALALLVSPRSSKRTMFGAGFALGVAGLVRLNLAYVPLFVGAYWGWRAIRGEWKLRAPELVAFVVGGILPVLASWAPYALNGLGHLWLDSVFGAPLAYSTTRYSAFEALAQHLRDGFGLWNLALWGPSLLGTTLLAGRWRRTSPDRKRGAVLVGLFFLGTGVSILQTGAVAEHYLIQIVPFLALPAATLYARLQNTGYRRFSVGLVLVGMAVPATPVALQYRATAERIAAGQPLAHGAQYQIAEFLREGNPEQQPVYLMTDHIVYWFTGLWPITRLATHPANVAKPELLGVIEGTGASPATEMRRILSAKPLFIVKLDDVWYLEGAPEAQRILASELADHYQLAVEIRGRKVYRRSPDQP